MPTSKCIFCSIIEKNTPEARVMENKHAIAILDVHPISKGHTMVVPKEHTETILQLSNESIGPVFELVREVVKKLKKELFEGGNDEGFTIGINHGINAGQVIQHLHIHIIPRHKGDGGKSIHSVVELRN